MVLQILLFWENVFCHNCLLAVISLQISSHKAKFDCQQVYTCSMAAYFSRNEGMFEFWLVAHHLHPISLLFCNPTTPQLFKLQYEVLSNKRTIWRFKMIPFTTYLKSYRLFCSCKLDVHINNRLKKAALQLPAVPISKYCLGIVSEVAFKMKAF